jgi:D-arabinose 1-dehydrogenase-like Zn-dependent alcohol dehydrogenase
MVALVEALVAILASLSNVDAAPLLCAGITTYNPLRHSGALPGSLIRMAISSSWFSGGIETAMRNRNGAEEA